MRYKLSNWKNVAVQTSQEARAVIFSIFTSCNHSVYSQLRINFVRLAK